MPKTIFETELYCNICEQETIHKIVYIYGAIDEIICENCGKTIRMNEKALLSHFSEDLFERIKSKPHRLTEEFKSDIKAFIMSVPARLISKPFKTLNEINELRREYKSHHEKK